MSDELENKAAEEEAAAARAAEDQAAENQNDAGLSEEEIAEEERIAAKKAEEHKEKSKFGRRLSAMEERMTDFLDKASNVIGNSPARNEAEDDDEPMTVGKFKQLMGQQSDENTKYSRGYEKTLRQIGATADDEDLHIQVMKLVTEDGSKFNVRSSEDPIAAAQINYYKALSSLDKKPKPKPNLKGDKNLPPAGSYTKTNPKAEPEMEFSQEVHDYMEKTGMTEKEVKELMKV